MALISVTEMRRLLRVGSIAGSFAEGFQFDDAEGLLDEFQVADHILLVGNDRVSHRTSSSSKSFRLPVTNDGFNHGLRNPD